MHRSCTWLIVVMSIAGGRSAAEDVPAIPIRTPQEMADRVDHLLAARWREQGIQSAADSTNSEFVRRVHLDLVGVIPRVSEVRRFLADPQPHKRAMLIDHLLDSPRHATHMANRWRQIMLPSGVDLGQLQSVAGVQNWLRRQFVANIPYDRVVSDFLVATGGGDTGPALYYTSLELQPEKLAASTSRIFLGLQIECAECHDHPFDHWTQEDFWGYAAFFAQLDRSGAMNTARQTTLVDVDFGEVRLPDSETIVPPKYPAGRVADRQARGSRRVQLAIWMASRDNPYLPRAAVNRIWAQLFGRGLVEPVDDLGRHNPASHPELMDELTDYFIDTGFDLRVLLRTLANTRAYQLSSISAGESEPDLFASMALKTMSADQLYDSLTRVLLGARQNARAAGPAGLDIDTRRIAFVAKMEMRGANATQFEAGVLQALTMLNGSRTAALTSVQDSGLLRAIQAPWLNDEQRINAMFLATLSRMPSESERQQFVEYVASGGPRGDSPQAMSDVLWALLNSAEFGLNH